MIRVFRDNGSTGYLTGGQVGVNDDGGWGTLDSYLYRHSLQAGSYILAIGEYFMSAYEARSGVASTPYSERSYTAYMYSQHGLSVSAVPLPASALLLIGGLAGLGLMRRRNS